MKVLEPWRTVIGVVNAEGYYDPETIASEIHALHCLQEGGEELSDRPVDYQLLPEIDKFRKGFVTDSLREYLHLYFDHELGPHRIDTNANWVPRGQGLFPHIHRSSHFSCVFYPESTKFGLSFFDPRALACRGYPSEFVKNHFRAQNISPKAGDMVIFPSYLQHSVSYVQEDLRLTLLNEFTLEVD